MSSSILDQLDSKRPNIAEVTFPVGDAGAKAAQQLAEATQRLELIKFMNTKRKAGEEKIDLKTAEADVRKARTRYAKTSVTLRFRGLTSIERDALSSEYGDVDEKETVDGPTWRKYTCKLLELAAVDAEGEPFGLTAEQWHAKLYESGRWSAGEVDHIRETARSAYLEVNAPGLPKD